MKMTETAKKNHDELFPGHVSILAEKDPEFIEVFDNFAFDEVLQYTSLDVKERQKVLLAALIAMQCVNEFKAMAKGALNVGVTPIEVKEIVYQAVPYAGLGKVFDFLHAANEVLEEEGSRCRWRASPTRLSKIRFEKGLEIVREAAGDAVDNMLDTMPQSQKQFGTFLADNCFGDFFTRSGLSIQERELLIFTMLASMGGAEAQMKGHIRNNLRVGNDKQKLLDTITVSCHSSGIRGD